MILESAQRRSKGERGKDRDGVADSRRSRHLYRRVDDMYGLGAQGTNHHRLANKELVFIGDEVYASKSAKGTAAATICRGAGLQVVSLRHHQAKGSSHGTSDHGGVHNVWAKAELDLPGSTKRRGEWGYLGELKGDCFAPGRELAWLSRRTGRAEAAVHLNWGGVVKDGLIYSTTSNTGLWIPPDSSKKERRSMEGVRSASVSASGFALALATSFSSHPDKIAVRRARPPIRYLQIKPADRGGARRRGRRGSRRASQRVETGRASTWSAGAAGQSETSASLPLAFVAVARPVR